MGVEAADDAVLGVGLLAGDVEGTAHLMRRPVWLKMGSRLGERSCLSMV
jgi:hypothetical protein